MKFKVRYSSVTGDHHSSQFSSEERKVEIEAENSVEAANKVEKDPNKTVISVETA